MGLYIIKPKIWHKQYVMAITFVSEIETKRSSMLMEVHIVWNAVIVDREYGSVSLENQRQLQEQYARNRINLRSEQYPTPADIIAGCQDTDAILITGNSPITKEVLESLPQLKVVLRFGIGVNSVDLDAATKAGTVILYMPGFCVQEMAVHASALILDLLRNISFYDRGIRKGEWRKAKGHEPRNPRNLTLGLYGFGGSAKLLYDIFHHGFGTKVITCDPYIRKDLIENYDVELVSFEELLERSDIVSLHAPLIPETRQIFDKNAFRRMKNDAMLVNVARGGLIQQEHLIEALKEGEIRFAGLDVFEEEPLPGDSPLIDLENTVLTCHSAFFGDSAKRNMLQLAVDLVDSVLNQSRVPGMYVANKGLVSKIPGFKLVE